MYLYHQASPHAHDLGRTRSCGVDRQISISPQAKGRLTLVHVIIFVATLFLQQNHSGRSTTTEVWVFGMVDTSQSPALGCMEVVSSRDAATLLPIIQAHMAPGTIIHLDQWSAYSRMASLPTVGTLSVVNHSLHFVDPATGTHA